VTRRALLAVGLLFVGLPLLLVACEITEVVQPAAADQGEVIEVTVTVEQPFDDAAAWKGVLSVLVPDDWTYVGGTYAGPGISGDMVEDADWSDSTDIVLPAGTGMKWIATLSETAHPVSNAPVFFDATLQFQVGQRLGAYRLGYFTTNTGFATADIAFGESASNTADSISVPITVNQAVANEEGAARGAFTVAQNAPNPFRGSTQIRYTLDEPAAVRLAVLDLTGREVAVIARGDRAAGSYAVTFDGADLPAGTYLYQLTANGQVAQTRLMNLAR
jgi:hypothetical protein